MCRAGKGPGGYERGGGRDGGTGEATAEYTNQDVATGKDPRHGEVRDDLYAVEMASALGVEEGEDDPYPRLPLRLCLP
jgi:hypothetical protein